MLAVGQPSSRWKEVYKFELELILYLVDVKQGLVKEEFGPLSNPYFSLQCYASWTSIRVTSHASGGLSVIRDDLHLYWSVSKHYWKIPSENYVFNKVDGLMTSEVYLETSKRSAMELFATKNLDRRCSKRF